MLSTTIQSVRELGRLRGEIDALLDRRGVPTNAAADTNLVVTELAVNGFEHGGATEVEVRVAVDEHRIAIELTHVGIADLAIPSWSSMPDPLTPRHRGLAIVDRLANDRETIVGPSGTTVRCFVAR